MVQAPAPRSLVERLRSPWVLAVATLFLLADFVLVALPWYWDGLGADLRPAMVRSAAQVRRWPPVENVFVVTGEGAPRLIHVDTGSFDDWELPLASRIHTILNVRVTGAPRAEGLWSPLWVSHRRVLAVTDTSTGEPASPELRDLAARTYATDLSAREYDPRYVTALTSEGIISVIRMVWPGVANELLVILAFVALVCSLGSISDLRAAKRLRLLASGVCPWCRYTVGEMARCPECGRILRLPPPTNHEGEPAG